jgi:putative transposase
MALPQRRKLAHTPPSSVPFGEIFFLTICGEPRGANQFAVDPSWIAVRGAASFFHDHHRWHLRLLLCMPDHVHALASFPHGESMKRVVGAWKHYLTHATQLTWQRDFFDHRLRSHESLDEKGHYIRMNPVRAGLVAQPQDWPFVWSPPGIVAAPV